MVLLGAITFAGLLCEGAVGDWAALCLRDGVGVSAERAGWGYAVFAALMFVGRAMGGAVGGVVGWFGARSYSTEVR